MTTVVGCAALATAASLLLALGAQRPSDGRLWGDEGTFVAMTSSLVRDGDLLFDENDLARLVAPRAGSHPALILQKTERGITFSKPILYPLLAAPLYALLGEAGMLATNLLLLGVALALSWFRLRRLGSPTHAFWTLATVLCGSVLLPYLGWRMSDVTQAAIVLAGLVLALAGLPPRSEDAASEARLDRFEWLPATGGFLLGAAVSMRLSTAALAVAPILAAVLYRRYRRATTLTVTALVGFLLATGATDHLLGTPNPYKAARSSFDERTGYPVGESSSEAFERFSTSPATQSATWRPNFRARQSAYSLYYFLFGRHTGLVPYFPAALVLLFAFIQRPNGVGLALLAAIFAIVAFYLLWMPENYFGGSTFLGNRYFLVLLPAMLVALSQLPRPRLMVLAWVVALCFWSSGLHSLAVCRGLDSTSQGHAHAGLFRLLPFESTAKNIDGVDSRYWRQDYVRFVDPYSKTGVRQFQLSSKMPASELVVATSWPGEAIKLEIHPSSPRAVLEVSDWQRTERFPLDGSADIAPDVLEVGLSPAWRRHEFWWEGEASYAVRSLRLRLLHPDGAEVTAKVLYLGRRLPPRIRPSQQVGDSPPTAARAEPQSR